MIVVPIRLSTLRCDVDLFFQIYVKVSDQYILYLKKGDSLTRKRFENLKINKVRQLFIEDADELKYQEFLDDFLTESTSNAMMSSTDKAEMVTGYAEQATESIHKDPASNRSYAKAQKTAKGIVGVLAQGEDVLKNIINIQVKDNNDLTDVLLRHCVNVSTMVARFGTVLGLSVDTIELLSTAGLYHDIGLTTLGSEVLAGLISEDKNLSQEVWAKYQLHPEKAISLIEGNQNIDSKILEYIIQHEEKRSGDGYPRGYKKFTPVQEVFNLCCYYSRKVICQRKMPSEVFKQIMIDEVGNYDLEMLKKFKNFLQTEGLS